ncbi:MAG TPA: hypothetical protein VF706_06950 [Solirubrobacteraceae bacterium]
MRSHRTTIFIGAFCATLAVAAPVPAQASSLLSGYGGPGQGNQAILGSALVNGPRGGGGGSGSSSSGSSGEAGSSQAAPSGEGATSGGATGGGGAGSGKGSSGKDKSGGASAPRAGGQARTGGGATAEGKSKTIGAASFYPASERIPAGASNGTLGLSGGDLALIVLGFAALAFIGVLTGRIARAGAARGDR